MFTRRWKWHFICESIIFLYANSIMFFFICVQNFMLLLYVVHAMFALEDAVSFKFALGAPHVKRRVKSHRPASAAPTKRHSMRSIVSSHEKSGLGALAGHKKLPSKSPVLRKMYFEVFQEDTNNGFKKSPNACICFDWQASISFNSLHWRWMWIPTRSTWQW